MTTATIAKDDALAHRALVAATLYGVAPKNTSDLLVLDATSFATTLSQMNESTVVVAVVVSSASAIGLLDLPTIAAHGDDAFARALRWSKTASRGPRAPSISVSALRKLVEAANAAGLVLIEPDLPSVFRTLPAARTKTPLDRAILATITLGAIARPLLFVPERRAPKNGLAKVRPERILDGWIAGPNEEEATGSSLLQAALAVLAKQSAPMRGKDLLRETRARRTSMGRPAGTADAASLAKDLVEAWSDNVVDAYAVDPAAPL